MNQGTLIEINEPYGTFNGMWEVTKESTIVEAENDIVRPRYELARRNKKAFCEIMPGEKDTLYLFDLVNTLSDTAFTLPPEKSLFEEGVEYRTFDPSEENRGFDFAVDGKDLIHWEYRDDSGEFFLQIIYYPQSKVVDIFKGQRAVNFAIY